MTSAPRELPAQIEPELGRAHRASWRPRSPRSWVCAASARLDFLSDGEDLFINEINTIPGSLSHYLWIDPAAVHDVAARLAGRSDGTPGGGLLLGGLGRVGPAGRRVHREQARMSCELTRTAR